MYIIHICIQLEFIASHGISLNNIILCILHYYVLCSQKPTNINMKFILSRQKFFSVSNICRLRINFNINRNGIIIENAYTTRGHGD